jgi:asparaginyl-tRNA synthetase
MRTLIKHALAATGPADAITLQGWVRTRRDSKGFSFLELNDGSCFGSIQVVVDAGTPGFTDPAQFTTGASVTVAGALVASPAQGQKWEVKASRVELVGPADATYPLQKKGHTLEFLRTIAHLRPRSNLFGAVFRTRSRLAFAVHDFFQKRDFVYVHTPIITASDCEGAGEMFRVTTLKGNLDEKPEADFFGKPAYLTVSGQLEAETFACALSNVYTFGPTFRAENSNTARHAAEFWMIEPEMAFCDLAGDMDLGEAFIQAMAAYALEHCAEDLNFFARFVDKGVLDRLKFVTERSFVRVPYTEAVDILKKSGKAFEFPVEYGQNLQSEHERFPHRGALQKPDDRFQLPARDQTVLHAAQRRRQDRHRHGCAGARHRRSHRRRAARGAARPARGQPRVSQAQAGGLLVVHRPAEVRQRAARGLWPGLRAAADVPDRRGQHPRRDPLRAHTGER